MMIPNPKYPEILHVCQNLRAMSYEEIFCAREGSTESLAVELYESNGFKWVGYYNGHPAALIGALKAHRGVWALFGLGTDDWQKIWKPVTRVAKRDMMQAVLDAGAHRAQCSTLASHTETHKWLRFLGATHEAELPAYGKNGEDCLMFSWLKEK